MRSFEKPQNVFETLSDSPSLQNSARAADSREEEADLAISGLGLLEKRRAGSTPKLRLQESGPSRLDGDKLASSRCSRLIEVVAQEAITVERTATAAHQAKLRQLAGLDSGDGVETMLQLEMRSYREHAEKKIDDLRSDLAGAAVAIQDYITRLSDADQGHEELLATDLERLTTLRRIRDVDQIHASLNQVCQNPATTLQQIKKQNQAVIIQLQDEIRTLHRTLDKMNGVKRLDPTNRGPLESNIRAKSERRELFSLYLVRIINWKMITGQLSEFESGVLAKLVTERLSCFLGLETFAGCWERGNFVAVVAVDKTTAEKHAGPLGQLVAGIYEDAGRSVTPQARVVVVASPLGQDVERTILSIQQLIEAFES